MRGRALPADRKDTVHHRLPTALTLSVVLAAGLLTTACGGSAADPDAADPAAAASQGQDSSGGAEASDGAASGESPADGRDDAGDGDASGTTADTSGDAAADGSGAGRDCGTGDLTWSARPRTQAGGYLQIAATAKPGVTCVLPAGLPVVAFGSGGIQAGPAEQSAGDAITLGGGRTLYAGVSPKTSSGDTGTEFGTVIVAVSEGDPDPVSLKIDPVVVDAPVVTSWHTDPADAVPLAQ
ncbi:hypothetical protein ABT026_18740 [Streptomyces sp. NPDC002734]|uniref:hypothetical protein n=1 Tax=Streptomyces sp. NPDC002734 TaxID=3154426 RepID=UPI00332EDC40